MTTVDSSATEAAQKVLGGLEVRINGEKVKTFDEQVLTLRVNTSAGESSITHIGPQQKVVDITFDMVDPHGNIRLDQLEEVQQQEWRERVAKSTSKAVTPDVLTQAAKDANAKAEKDGKADNDKAGPTDKSSTDKSDSKVSSTSSSGKI